MWQLILSSFHCEGLPRCLEELGNILGQFEGQKKTLLSLLCAALLWTCWLERNQCCFSNSRPISIQTYKAKFAVLIQYWAGAWEEDLKAAMDRVLQSLGFTAADSAISSSPQGSSITLEHGERSVSIPQPNALEVVSGGSLSRVQDKTLGVFPGDRLPHLLVDVEIWRGLTVI